MSGVLDKKAALLIDNAVKPIVISELGSMADLIEEIAKNLR